MFSRIVSRNIKSSYQVLKIAPYSIQINKNICVLSKTANVPSAMSNDVISRNYSDAGQGVVDFDYVKAAVQNNTRILIVDVRDPDETKEHGHIPSSINIPFANVKNALNMDAKDFEKTYKTPKPKKETEIIFYCMIGKRSEKAKAYAVELGYNNSKNYYGSYVDWTKKCQDCM